MKLPKTNAARLMDAAKIPYELIAYHVEEHDLGALHVAQQLNEPIEQVFKTIVLRGDKTGVLVVVLPGDKEVDLKKIAKVSGNKSCAPLQQKELLPTTGYIRGGCSPIGMKKLYPTYFHTTCVDFPYIYVSAGVRGMQAKVEAKALIALTKAQLTDLIAD